MKHNGRYSCVASNMAGDTELIFNVEIQGLFRSFFQLQLLSIWHFHVTVR